MIWLLIVLVAIAVWYAGVRYLSHRWRWDTERGRYETAKECFESLTPENRRTLVENLLLALPRDSQLDVTLDYLDRFGGDVLPNISGELTRRRTARLNRTYGESPA